MKKVVMIIICLFVIFTYNINVYAKDTFYSLNKYNEEKLNFVFEGYNDKHESNGMIVAGEYLKEVIDIDDNKYNDTQVLLMKYNNNGKVLWTYSYGKNIEDKLYYVNYSYDNSNNVDGYILTVSETSDIFDNNTNGKLFVRVDLSGKEVYQKNFCQIGIS